MRAAMHNQTVDSGAAAEEIASSHVGDPTSQIDLRYGWELVEVRCVEEALVAERYVCDGAGIICGFEVLVSCGERI